MPKRPSTVPLLIHRPPCAGLPRNIYRWESPDGWSILYAIDSFGRLVDIAPDTPECLSRLDAILNDRDPLPPASPRPAALRGAPALVLIR